MKKSSYAKRSAIAVFLFVLANALLDSTPMSPLHGSGFGGRLFGGLFLASILSVVAAAIGGAIGDLLDRRESADQAIQEPKVAKAVSENRRTSEERHLIQLPELSVQATRKQETLSTDQHTNVESPDEDIWAAALSEVEGPSRRTGLWARAFAESQGNEAAAKAAYIKYRVDELQRERRAVLVRQREEEAVRVLEAKLAHLSPEERAEELAPKGRCPNANCGALMPLTRKECKACGAIFGVGGWQLLPVSET